MAKNRFITVLKWDNASRAFIPVVQIQPLEQAFPNGPIRVEPVRLGHSLNKTGLVKSTTNKRLPPRIADLLPGQFAEKLLEAADINWSGLSEFMKLYELGSRNMGAYQIVAIDRDSNQPIVGTEKLEGLFQKLHVALSLNELEDIFTNDNFYSLTATTGSQPKIEYQDEVGNRYVAKTVKPSYGNLAAGHVKVEHALNLMQKAAGISTAESKLHICKNGQAILLSQRFNLEEPIFQKGSNIADHNVKQDSISFKTMSAIAYSEGHQLNPAKGSYTDLIACIKLYSSDPENDKRELLKRALFNVVVNNTDNHDRNFELLENKDGTGFRLSPNFDVTPDVGRAPFQIAISKMHTSQQMIYFNEQFFDVISKEFEVSKEEVKEYAARISAVVDNRLDFFKASGMTDEEINYFQPAFLSSDRLFQDKEYQNKPMFQQWTQFLSESSPEKKNSLRPE